MTKQQTIRRMKDVISGVDSSTWIGIDKKKKGYEVYTSLRNPNMQMNFQHFCNEITLVEVKKLLEDTILRNSY